MIAPSLPVDRPGCGESFHSPADRRHQKNTKTYQEIDTGDVEEVRRLKEIAKGGAIAVTSAVLVASVAAACTSIAHSSLDHQPKFTITNTISSSSTTQTPALLYPGSPVTSGTPRTTADGPDHGNNDEHLIGYGTGRVPNRQPQLRRNDLTGSLVVPAQGSNSVPVPISLFETHKNQDSCENTTFRFDFQGTATFNVVPRRQPF